MTLSSQVVNLVRLDLSHQPTQIRRIRQITVMKEEIHTLGMWIFVQVIDSSSVERRRTTNDSVYLISLHLNSIHQSHFRQKQLRKIRTVLACNTSDQSNFLLCSFFFYCFSRHLIMFNDSIEVNDAIMKLP